MQNEYLEGALLGMSEEQARTYLTSTGISNRIVQIDDTHFMITDDYDPDRVNLVLTGGIVTKVSFG